VCRRAEHCERCEYDKGVDTWCDLSYEGERYVNLVNAGGGGRRMRRDSNTVGRSMAEVARVLISKIELIFVRCLVYFKTEILMSLR
jgi:hypothetical protein